MKGEIKAAVKHGSMEKRTAALQEDLQTLNRDMSMLQFKSTFVLSIIMISLVTALNR